MSDAVRSHACDHILRVAELVIQSYEGLSVCIEAVHRGIHAIERIVVATLLVLSLMIDHRAVDLNLSGREVSLEILHVRSSVPETPLRK